MTVRILLTVSSAEPSSRLGHPKPARRPWISWLLSAGPRSATPADTLRAPLVRPPQPGAGRGSESLLRWRNPVPASQVDGIGEKGGLEGRWRMEHGIEMRIDRCSCC